MKAMLGVLLAATICGTIWAQPTPTTQTAPETAAPPATQATTAHLTAADKLAVTKHQLTIAGKTLRYTATAGYMPIKDDHAKVRANVFFIAYTKDPDGPTSDATTRLARSADRPITFVFNGGPGAASVWLHLGTAGPYRVALEDSGAVTAPPYRLVPNEHTWLTQTDLVFIDPVGTGYSRATNPEQAKEFYNTREDIRSVGEFIRLYATKYERWDSPKFVAGESYGTTRAAALTEYLHDKVGMALNGVILISSVLNFQTLNPSESNDLPYALFLPSYTAVAFYHKKLPDDLMRDFTQTIAKAREFAATTYTVALTKGASLPANERAALVQDLARFTGLSSDYLDQSNLRVHPSRFEQMLLADKDAAAKGRKVIGRMDGRLTGFVADGASDAAEFDPSLSMYVPVYTSTFNTYVRQTLRYDNDLPYEILKGLGWDFNTGGGPGGFLYVGDELRSAMQKNPHMKVLFASGYYDLATPFFSTDYTINHLTLAPPLRQNITHTYYHGGHMMYHDKAMLEKLNTDLMRFVEGAARKER